MSIKEEYKDLSNALKETFSPPSPISAKKAPTGKGTSKGDMLVQRLAVEFQHDPIEELVKLARSNRVSPDLKAKINLELIQYYIPKLRAIDTNPNQGETISINIINPSISSNSTSNQKIIDITS